MYILAASLRRSLLPPCGDLGCLLTASSWRTIVSSWRTSLFDRFLNLQSGFLHFFLPVGIVATFSLSSARRFCCLLYFSPWTNLYWWCRHYGQTLLSTLRSDFVGLSKIVVTFRLIRHRALYFCEFHRSTFLMYFSDITVGLLLYFILYWLVFANVTIRLFCWSFSWRAYLPIFLLLLIHHVMRQSAATRLWQDFCWIMLVVRYNFSIVCFESLASLALLTSVCCIIQ